MPPSLETFIKNGKRKSFVDHPEFDPLYLRQGDVGVIVDNTFMFCRNTLTIENIQANRPGGGAFTRLLAGLLERDLAIYVQCVQNIRFVVKLKKLGFTQVNKGTGKHFLLNYERHVIETRTLIG